MAIHYLGHNSEDLKFFAIHPSLLRQAVGLQDVRPCGLPIKMRKRVAALADVWTDSSLPADDPDSTRDSRPSLQAQKPRGSTSTYEQLQRYSGLCSKLRLSLEAAAGSMLGGKHLPTLLYLSGVFGLQKPLLRGLQEDYDGILAITHEKRVLVYYSNKALSSIDLPQLVRGLSIMKALKDNLRQYRPETVNFSEQGLEIALPIACGEDGELLLTPHRVFATKDERARYQVQWVARMEAENQLMVGLIEHGVSVSDLSRPALWRKTPNEEHPFVFIGFHGFYDDLEQMAIRRRVFIQASEPAKTRGVDKTMNDCREWRENLRQQLILLLYNMLLLRENHDIRANKDYTLRAPVIIQYEQID